MRSSRVWMRSRLVWVRDLAEFRWDLAELLERLAVNTKAATVLGSIPASSDTVESEGRQMKQCWITYIKRKIPKNPPSTKSVIVEVIYSLYCVYTAVFKWFFRNKPLLKGIVPRDFRPQVFFMNQFPPSPCVSHSGRFEFFRKSRRYLQLKVYHQCRFFDTGGAPWLANISTNFRKNLVTFSL
jgi:hypothetical protein